MLDAPTDAFHQSWEEAGEERLEHTDGAETNTNEESSARTKGYLGQESRMDSRACLKVSWWVSSVSSSSTGNGYALAQY